jgi:hypothetical protein
MAVNPRETDVAITELQAFVGRWELAVDLPGAEDTRGHVEFDLMGDVLVQRTTIPNPDAPDSCCVVLAGDDGSYLQHYFDSRGVARLYRMTFDGRAWTLERTESDYTPLDFHQRYVGALSDDLAMISGEWQSSSDGRDWSRDFGLTYYRAV